MHARSLAAFSFTDGWPGRRRSFFKSPQNPQSPQSSESALTIVEMMVATGLIAMMGSLSLLAITQMNRFASGARLQTLALACAQQRAEEILTTRWNSQSGRPAILAQTGTAPAVLDPAGGVEVKLKTGDLNSGSTLDSSVPGRLYTFIEDRGPRSVRAEIILAYTFRGKPYAVRLTTFRAADNI